jgi:3'(2'), 5'-bisphosphate nucleotidase
MTTNLITSLRRLAQDAGEAILSLYDSRSQADAKQDGSPVTAADRAAHEILTKGLRSLTPGVPVVSEEDPAAHDSAAGADTFWLVDPLDGTKEFIRGSGDFTVNIALIRDGEPRLGIVGAPASGTTYFASRDEHSVFVDVRGTERPIRTRGVDSARIVLAASRDHAGPMIAAAEARDDGRVTVRRAGSSLKFCLVAEGKADLYLRDGRTMWWDTAAAQCVLECAGGVVLSLDGAPLRYSGPSLANPSFVALGDKTFDWRSFLSDDHIA